jgi:hypothetical protein
MDFCFLLAATYLRHATKCLPSVEVELELEMANNFLHHLHCDFLTLPTSTITESFQTGESSASLSFHTHYSQDFYQ